MRLKFCIILFFIHYIFAFGQSKPEVSYGLKFNSYEVEKDLRTGLNLTPEGPLSVPECYSISFCVKLQEAYHLFGYVFRMVAEDGRQLDFLLSRPDRAAPWPSFSFVDASGLSFLSFSMDKINVDFEQWLSVKILLNLRKNQIQVEVNEKPIATKELFLKGFHKIHLFFGKNDYPFLQTSDVATMSIRDIKIENENGKTLFYWALSRHSGKYVYDEVRKQKAECVNPNWIMDQHVYWKKNITFNTGKNPQVCYDSDQSRIILVDKKQFYTYSPGEKEESVIAFSTGVPQGSNANQLLYNHLKKQHFTYNFKDPIAVFDTITHSWNNLLYDKRQPSYWHHNRVISPLDSNLYVFGGYGYHTYHNDVKIYDFRNKTWTTSSVKGDNMISPRYLSGLGMLDDDSFLLFGGYGSETGSQELAPHNLYDLFKVDLKTLKAEKLWELEPQLHNFAVANSLIVDTLSRAFYALCFSNQRFNTIIRLYKFSIDTPDYEILADSIPYSFDDIASFADLYYDRQRGEFITVISSAHANDTLATVSVYSLAFPPLSMASLEQKKPSEFKINVILLCFVIAITGISVFFLIGYKKNRFMRKSAVHESTDEKRLGAHNEDDTLIIKSTIRKQSVSLLGGFQVIDKNSNDITGEFTPIVKQLFLLIFLNTMKDGKGISSIKLKDTLWYDKNEESARNNRGVGLSKLRVIFERVGKVTINKNFYWTIQLGDDIYCDYSEVQRLLAKLEITNVFLSEDINNLLSIALTGDLLPNLQEEWIDSFKSAFSNRLIDVLFSNVNKYNDQMSPQMKLNVANVIFLHDPLNEDALHLKCSVLTGIGKNGLAKNIYNSFVKEYKSLFAVNYKCSFEEIVNKGKSTFT